jgi:putative hydrolase of the HAD superfamily
VEQKLRVERQVDRAKVVSFDLDGTVTDISFVNSVWLEGIPRLYALKSGLSFQDAKNFVTSEYGKVGRERLEWYNLGFWMAKLGLNASPEEVLNVYQNKIRVYPDVIEVLQEFRTRGLRLIIVSNARREFADLELEKTGIRQYFERVFSSTSDLGLIKKTVSLYQKVCSLCSVSPSEMVHVGDDECFDFEVPNKLGIIAFYLDRTGKHSGDHVVHGLRELSGKLAHWNHSVQ